MLVIDIPEPQLDYEYSIEYYKDEPGVYVLVHERIDSDTEIFVFGNLADAVEHAQYIAESNLQDHHTEDDIEQRYDETLYWIVYPNENHIWIVRRKVR